MTHVINTVQKSFKKKKESSLITLKQFYSFQKKIKGTLYSLGFMFVFLKFRCCQNIVPLKVSLLRVAGGSFWIIFL